MKAPFEVDLDRIFASFYEDRQSPAPKPLASWIAEYPELKGSIVQWAAEIPAIDLAELRPAAPELEARSLAIGRSVLDRLGLGAPTDVLVSFNDAARRRGVSPRQLSERLGIGMTLFAKLNRRLVRASTVPARLIDRLAEELQVSIAHVESYLSQGPALAQGAAYRSEVVPSVTEAEDFAEAVRSCVDMSEEQKRQWTE